MWYVPPSPELQESLLTSSSGIFGYINYLVERDREFIINTLLNGE